MILPDLSIGADVTKASFLRSNENLASQGVTPLGTGFRLTSDQIKSLGYRLDELPSVIKRYAIGRDLVQRMEEKFIIDFFGLSEEEASSQYPKLMQVVVDYVLPERVEKRDSYRKKWWLFAEPRQVLRNALNGKSRYVATCRTAKHRIFTFLDYQTLPDAKIVAIALSDAYFLGAFSSRIHLVWATAAGGWLGVGNDSNYNHSDCFNKFPFPDPTGAQKSRIRELGERLDEHRKRQQAQYPDLTLTDMYNVLEKERAGEALTEKERRTHERGLIGLLRQIHDELDAAVAEAYGWPADLPEAEILERLVQLNAQRAAEEAAGHIRWLRPEYQAPGVQPGVQGKLLEEEPEAAPAAGPVGKHPWPDQLPAQAAALRDVLTALGHPADLSAIAVAFEGKATAKRKGDIERLLETMRVLGQVEVNERGSGGRVLSQSRLIMAKRIQRPVGKTRSRRKGNAQKERAILPDWLPSLLPGWRFFCYSLYLKFPCSAFSCIP